MQYFYFLEICIDLNKSLALYLCLVHFLSFFNTLVNFCHIFNQIIDVLASF